MNMFRFTFLSSVFVFLMLFICNAGASQTDASNNTNSYKSYTNCDTLSFNRVATFANYRNNEDISEETVSEIVSATEDGMTLVYTDGAMGALGLVDIKDPSNPKPKGKIVLGGEPTSVSVLDNDLALVGVDTSESYTNPSGKLSVVSISQGSIVVEFQLNGQPDSLAISPDKQYAAIAIENERDEEICAGGTQGGFPVPEDGPEKPGDITAEACEDGGGVVGGLPQTPYGNPAGFLVIVDILGKDPAAWTLRNVSMTGLSEYAPEDPEPEFVDINSYNEVAVTLQENNHMVVVDVVTGQIVSHFPMGTVDLTQIDATEDDMISLSETLTDIPREPDAVSWIPTSYGDLIATANEGDIFGGSRGFSIFDKNGSLVYDSGNSLEHLAVQYGHYPEGRSENKGCEPEAIEFGRYQAGDFLFVGSERGSFVAVYRMGFFNKPHFEQFLPAPLGPEGVLAIADRNLLVVSGEEDDPSYGLRSSIMIYQLQQGAPNVPQIASASDENGTPIPWSALSGMTSITGHNDLLLGVWDSFYKDSKIFLIDVSGSSPVIIDSVTITGGTGDYDPEGIAVAPDGTIWVASEGGAPGNRLNRLIQVDLSGVVINEVTLPAEIENCRAASENTSNLSKGFEGVAVVPLTDGNYVLLAAQQLPWYYTTTECEALDDEEGFTRIWVYDPSTAYWGYVAYELAPIPENASWVGLSEITRTSDRNYMVIERDNRTGDFANVKSVVNFDVESALDGLISVDDKDVFDIIADLNGNHGWISDKAEGLAITSDGQVYLCTDNDGVDDWSGESWFLNLGNYQNIFGDR